jgi:dolichyldiphosphatase
VAALGGGRGIWKRGSATTQLRACSKGSMEGGLLSALRVSTAKNTRWLVAGSAAAVLLWRRDAVAISCIAGAIGNAIISKILKRILNQERPEGATVSDPGMPSSHAMSLFFFASYLSSSLIFWATWPSPGFRAASVAALAAFAVNSAAWRVTAGLHTREQVGRPLPLYHWPCFPLSLLLPLFYSLTSRRMRGR